MRTIKIITDSSSDLPQEMVDKYGITVVPLSVHFGGECMPTHMEASDFYARMRKESELPKTSSPSPQLFLTAYEAAAKDQDILVIGVSSALSSTYNHALMAKDMLLEDGYAGRIEVIDSKTASLGLGILVYRAAEMVEEGIPFERIVDATRQAVPATRTYFCLDTLENVIKGGRLDRVRGAVASVLNIKLLMRASLEGSVEVVEKVRGTQKVLQRMIDKLSETGHDYARDIVAIAHSNCEERAREVLKQLLEKYPFRKVIFSNMGPVIGTYAGEGTVLVAY